MPSAYNVPQDYSSIQLAIDAIPNDLSALGLQEVLVSAGSYSEALNIGGFANRDANNYVEIKAQSDSKHNGFFGTGVVLDAWPSVLNSYMRFTNIEFDLSAVYQIGQPDITWENVIVKYNTTGDPISIAGGGERLTLIKFVLWNPGFGAVGIRTLTNQGANAPELHNCVIRGYSQCYNFSSGGSNAKLYNCIAIARAGDEGFKGGELNNCASNDNSGSVGLQNLTEEQFNFVSSATGDFHTQSGSVLIDAGDATNTSAVMTTDIDGTTIPLDSWPVGYDYLVVASGGVNITSTYKGESVTIVGISKNGTTAYVVYVDSSGNLKVSSDMSLVQQSQQIATSATVN